MGCPYLDAFGDPTEPDSEAMKAAAKVIREWDWRGYNEAVVKATMKAADIMDPPPVSKE